MNKYCVYISLAYIGLAGSIYAMEEAPRKRKISHQEERPKGICPPIEERDGKYHLQCNHCPTSFSQKSKPNLRATYKKHMRRCHAMCCNERCPLFEDGQAHESSENAELCWKSKKKKGFHELVGQVIITPQGVIVERDREESQGDTTSEEGDKNGVIPMDLEDREKTSNEEPTKKELFVIHHNLRVRFIPSHLKRLRDRDVAFLLMELSKLSAENK